MIQILNVNPYSSNNIDSYSTIHNLFPYNFTIRNNYISELFTSEIFNNFIRKSNLIVSLILQFMLNFYNYFHNYSYKLLEPFTNALDKMDTKMYMTFGSFDEKYMYSSSLFMINLLCFFIILFAILVITEKIYNKINLLTNEIETHNKLRFRMKEQNDLLRNQDNELYRILNYVIIQNEDNERKINKIINKKLKKNNETQENNHSNDTIEKLEHNKKKDKQKESAAQNKNKQLELKSETDSPLTAKDKETNQEKFGNGRYSKRERKTIQ